ncbi:GFA family protein [Vreelandella sp. GE22]
MSTTPFIQCWPASSLLTISVNPTGRHEKGLPVKVTCHCGNVEITAAHFPEEIGQCNCSICRRYAALWAYYSPNLVTINCRHSKTVFYSWGDKEAEFHWCTTCGCTTHYQTTERCDESIVAINMRLADEASVAEIPVRNINGAAS